MAHLSSNTNPRTLSNFEIVSNVSVKSKPSLQSKASIYSVLRVINVFFGSIYGANFFVPYDNIHYNKLTDANLELISCVICFINKVSSLN